MAELDQALVEQLQVEMLEAGADRSSVMARLVAHPREAMLALDRLRDNLEQLRVLVHRAQQR